jgi:hypothetical protein
LVQSVDVPLGPIPDKLQLVVAAVRRALAADKPVIVFTGAHLIKGGLSLLLIDLMRRNIVTAVATTGAGMIHDFELALIGATSEDVVESLPAGRFGMCTETSRYMNKAFRAAVNRGIGAGEALGRLIRGEAMPKAVKFLFPYASIAASGIDFCKPVTMHASIGTDIIDQHKTSDLEAKGASSGVDFRIFAAQVCDLAGGVFLNIGSAVQGPEVFLKAVSMAANIGKPPIGLTTASFDLRMWHDDNDNYYFRDMKSVVTRIPLAFEGTGYYVHGDIRTTFPLFYHALSR